MLQGALLPVKAIAFISQTRHSCNNVPPGNNPFLAQRQPNDKTILSLRSLSPDCNDRRDAIVKG